MIPCISNLNLVCIKTLAYFGFGIEVEDFSDFDYDQIILVNLCLDISKTILTAIVDYKKIIKMACDALVKIDLLKEQKIKLDYFINIKEGLH